MKRNSNWKELFVYDKEERRGVSVLIIIILALILYHIYSPFAIRNDTDFTEFKNYIAYSRYLADSSSLANSNIKKNITAKKEFNFNLFYFNPNTISKKGWQKLGLKEYQAKSIRKYIRKGGTISSPNDLRKMYCLSQGECDLLIPYVKIEQLEVVELEDKVWTKTYIPKVFHLELNTVQFDSLLEINGVGPSTAKAILAYRKKLGGYYNIKQLQEVYLIDSAKHIKLSPNFYINTDSIHPYLNLNKDDYYLLKKHPYISKKIAYNIQQYRDNNGEFSNIEQLKNVEGINDSVYLKLYWYFEL